MYKLRTLLLAFAAAVPAVPLDATAPDSTHKIAQEQHPVAVLAMGTNGGDDVRGETQAMIRRLQNAGYRVVVVPPRNAARVSTGANLMPHHRAVMAAARACGADIVMPRRWHSDGYHISTAEAVRIGRMFRGAATFGDSNSVRINAGTGGRSYGVPRHTTTQILAGQYPRPHTTRVSSPRTARQP